MPFNFKQKIKEVKRVQRNIPIKIGNIAKNHFLDSFKKEGFVDKTLDKWEKRKFKNRSDKNNRGRRALLVDKGHLRRSLKVGRAAFSRIEVGSYGIRYAVFHNKGTNNIPKRQFIGNSRVMNQKIRDKIKSEIKKTLR